MGDKVWVKVVATNLDKRQIDYEWVITSSMKGSAQPNMFTEIEQEFKTNEKASEKTSEKKIVKKKKKPR